MEIYRESEKFKDTIAKIGEMSFFEQAYSGRKFLIDKNVIGPHHPDFPENIRDFFYGDEPYGPYDWVHAQELFQSFLRLYFTLKYDPLKNISLFNMINDPLEKIISNTCEVISNRNKIFLDTSKWNEITVNLQNRFIYFLIKDTESNENVKNFYLSNSILIPENDDLIKYLHQFFLISCKYGMYFADLIMQPDINTIINFHYNSQKNDTLLAPNNIPHITPIDFYNETHNIDKQKFFANRTSVKRTLEYMFGNKNKNTEISFINKSKDIIKGTFRTNSVHGRLLGLWLWDNVDSPRATTKLLLKDAIKLLIDRYPQVKDSWPDNYDGILRRYYNWTKECVEQGKILGFSSNANEKK